jgi:hypothetical protein
VVELGVELTQRGAFPVPCGGRSSSPLQGRRLSGQSWRTCCTEAG